MIDSADYLSTHSFASSSDQKLLRSHVYARLAWSHENHRKALDEHRQQEEHRLILAERQRLLCAKIQAGRAARAGLDRAAVQATHQRNRQVVAEEKRVQRQDQQAREAARLALMETVRRRKEERVGRVAASRSALLERNKSIRREEGQLEQFALEEKQRRLEQMKIDHQRELAKRFVVVDERVLMNHPDSFRLLTAGSRASGGTSSPMRSIMSARSMLFRPSSAAEIRRPIVATSEHVFGARGLRGVESPALQSAPSPPYYIPGSGSGALTW